MTTYHSQLVNRANGGQLLLGILLQLTCVEIAREILLSQFRNTVRTTSKIQQQLVIRQFTASLSNVFPPIVDGLTDLCRRFSDNSVFSDIREIFQNSIISRVGHPFGRAAHIFPLSQSDLYISLGSLCWVVGGDYIPWEVFSTHSKHYTVETTEGLSGPSQNTKGPVLEPPALGGLPDRRPCKSTDGTHLTTQGSTTTQHRAPTVGRQSTDLKRPRTERETPNAATDSPHEQADSTPEVSSMSERDAPDAPTADNSRPRFDSRMTAGGRLRIYATDDANQWLAARAKDTVELEEEI